MLAISRPVGYPRALCEVPMFRVLSALTLVALLGACGGELTQEIDEAGAPDEVSDPAKADVASPVALSGGITLEDDFAVSLPATPKYVGYIVLAPGGAKLTATANGGTLATRVTVYGPRAANGNFGPQLASAVGAVSLTTPASGAYLVVPQPRYQNKSGNATLSMRCTGTHCQGYCSAAAPTLTHRDWVHGFKTPLVTAAGSAKHRAYDLVAAPNANPVFSAKFGYGAVDKALEDEDVDLWIRSCPGWVKAGTARTDDEGVATLTLNALPPGDYQVLWHVPGDGTTAEGTLAVWESGRKIAVSDIDGTLTTDDGQVFKQIFLGSDPAQYPDAEKVLWTVRREGYRIQYLTGRPEALGRSTKSWLKAHRFPPGVVKLTDSALEVLPTESGVGQFKTDYLGHLRTELGTGFFTAFGNATTDISAYQANGIPDARDFIIGPHGGEQGTVSTGSYGAILPKVKAFSFLTGP